MPEKESHAPQTKPFNNKPPSLYLIHVYKIQYIVQDTYTCLALLKTVQMTMAFTMQQSMDKLIATNYYR